jgi:hypothetical protein
MKCAEGFECAHKGTRGKRRCRPTASTTTIAAVEGWIMNMKKLKNNQIERKFGKNLKNPQFSTGMKTQKLRFLNRIISPILNRNENTQITISQPNNIPNSQPE